MKVEKFTLEFENITYDVVNNSRGRGASKYLRLINGVSGYFESGSVTAIMGPSGSCKTSFLDFITGRVKRTSRTGGVVKLKGRIRSQQEWLFQHCYLEQDDCIVPKQTVYEYILFSISCRRQELSSKEIVYRIKDMMEQLSISNIADVDMSSLSGGERKRVMIAVEFAVGAQVLILDEPTSGLDSHLSLQLVHMLKTYAAQNNKIVIMTIHQPGAGLFEMIDHLYFFYKGCIIYDGKVSQLGEFLDSKGLLAQTSLSKPELLFELFTEYSIIKEVRDCKESVVKLIEERRAETCENSKNVEMVSGSTFNFLNLDMNFGHLGQIYKRGIVINLRGMGVFSIMATFALSLIWGWVQTIIFLFTIYLYLIPSGFVTLDDFGILTAVSSFMGFVENEASLVYNLWTKVTAMAAVTSICFILALFMNSSVLRSKTNITRETYKGTYSMTTFLFAALCVELTLSFVFCTIFLVMLQCIGIKRVLMSPSILIYTYGGCLISKILCIFFETICSGGTLFSTLIGMLKLLMCVFFSLPSVVCLSNVIKMTKFRHFTMVKYPLMIASINFWKEYFYNGIYDDDIRILQEEVRRNEGKFSESTQKLYSILLEPGYIFEQSQSQLYPTNGVRGWFMGITYPNWVHLCFGVGTAVIVLLASIFIINLKYSPSLRLKHSK